MPARIPQPQAVKLPKAVEISDNFGYDKAANEWWFTVSVGDKEVYAHSGYPNERAATTDMARYRTMAEEFARRQVDDLKREQTRPYTVLIVAPQREIALQLIPFLRWRLGLANESDAEFLNTLYGHRIPLGTVVDGIVYVHPAKAEIADPGILEKAAIPLTRDGWRAFLGGPVPWKNARDLLLPQ